MRRRNPARENKSRKYHLNIPLSEYEAQQVDKYCGVHGSRVALVRSLLKRHFREMEATDEQKD